MDRERRCLQVGAIVVVFSVFLRLISTGAITSFIRQPWVFSLVLLSETGRWVSPAEETVVFTETEEKAPPSEIATPEVDNPPQMVSFSQGDLDLVEVTSACSYEVDLTECLQMPLAWDLTQNGPAVLIVHSHGSESYKKTENYTESTPYRTLDKDYNVVSIGAYLAELLETGGIGVIHDTTIHDHPSYNNSYIESRDAVNRYLEEYPSIRMVLDIHRDAVETADGKQKGYTVSVNGQDTAQLMMVVGTDASGRNHPDWQDNMALAVKLHVQLQKLAPGICRPISFRTQRFNQDLSAGAMLIEVGAAGNTRQEALLATEQLAQGILSLAYGTEGEIY